MRTIKQFQIVEYKHHDEGPGASRSFSCIAYQHAKMIANIDVNVGPPLTDVWERKQFVGQRDWFDFAGAFIRPFHANCSVSSLNCICHPCLLPSLLLFTAPFCDSYRPSASSSCICLTFPLHFSSIWLAIHHMLFLSAVYFSFALSLSLSIPLFLRLPFRSVFLQSGWPFHLLCPSLWSFILLWRSIFPALACVVG